MQQQRQCEGAEQHAPDWQRIRLLRKQLEAKELEECTFAPNIHIRANPARGVIELNPRPRVASGRHEEPGADGDEV